MTGGLNVNQFLICVRSYFLMSLDKNLGWNPTKRNLYNLESAWPSESRHSGHSR